MNYEILVGALTLIGMLAVVIRPIINLNSSITALTGSVDSLKEMISKLEGRIDSHGKEIDGIQIELADHEARIKVLEK